ncbi:VOC family protein [Desertibaculum subflavum]|uniref:VOC family protein n=1 Tax=Desertibaculum subflavum TaxID=2268458 RepID=UPI000E6603EF
MDQRISLITLGVRDLNRARAFYERLGWKRAFFGAEGVAFFQTGGMALALYPRRDLAKDAGVEEANLGERAAVTLALNMRSKEEVDASMAEAEAAGARITMPAREAFWGGYIGHFADPEGFLWEIAWNPAFRLTEDGSVVLPD